MDAIQELICEQGKLMNAQFQTPRSYGYAIYRLVGGHGAWKKTRDAHKIYISVNHTEKKWFGQKGNIIQKKLEYAGCAIAVIREGGYDGTSNLPTLKDLFAQEGFEEITP